MSQDVTLAVLDNDVILTRYFNAPCTLVFEAWTNPDHIARWFGPHFLEKASAIGQRRENGPLSITMHGPDGTGYPMDGNYEDYIENQRVTYRMALKDHPAEFYTMITSSFEELRDGRQGEPTNRVLIMASFADQDGGTLVTLTMRFENPIERDVHYKMGMNEGWSESFEKLDRLLLTLGPTGNQ